MREAVLQKFFEGFESDEQLARDVAGSLTRSGNQVTVRIERMDAEFVVEARHLIRVCDAVLSGNLDPANLAAIGFALQASNAFIWDGSTKEGERVAETVSDWSAPEINFPLTLENVGAWKTYLINGSREGLRSVLAHVHPGPVGIPK